MVNQTIEIPAQESLPHMPHRRSFELKENVDPCNLGARDVRWSIGVVLAHGPDSKGSFVMAGETKEALDRVEQQLRAEGLIRPSVGRDVRPIAS